MATFTLDRSFALGDASDLLSSLGAYNDEKVDLTIDFSRLQFMETVPMIALLGKIAGLMEHSERRVTLESAP